MRLSQQFDLTLLIILTQRCRRVTNSTEFGVTLVESMPKTYKQAILGVGLSFIVDTSFDREDAR